MAQKRTRRRRRSSLRTLQRTLRISLPILLLILLVLLGISRIQKNAAGETQTAEADETDIVSVPPEESADSADDSATDSPEASDETPSEEPEATETEDTSEPVTLVFTGDVLLSDYVLSNYNSSGISGVVSPDVLNQLTQADLTIINNEFPFSTRGTQAPDKQFTFRVNPSYVSVLTDMGVDIAGLANNHVLDYGSDALLDTFDTLDAAGIDYMGAGEDLSRASALITKEIGGQTFGFLAASRVIPVVSWDVNNSSPGVFTTYDPTQLVTAIQEARDKCDYLTVLVHWGIERDAYPQEYQTQLAKQYIDAGADLIIGAHPHVLQGISYYNGKPICYSLGNFIFNQEIPQTAMVKVTIEKGQEPVIQLLAASATGAYTYLCEGQQKTDIYQYIQQISTDITVDADGYLSPQS